MEVPPVLPPYNLALAQIADVRNTGLPTRLHDHPADVRIPEALVCIVGVELSVGVTMVRAVSSRPPLNGALNGTCACDRQCVLERLGGIIRPVSPETVVTSRDSCEDLAQGVTSRMGNDIPRPVTK